MGYLKTVNSMFNVPKEIPSEGIDMSFTLTSFSKLYTIIIITVQLLLKLFYKSYMTISKSKSLENSYIRSVFWSTIFQEQLKVYTDS